MSEYISVGPAGKLKSKCNPFNQVPSWPFSSWLSIRRVLIPSLYNGCVGVLVWTPATSLGQMSPDVATAGCPASAEGTGPGSHVGAKGAVSLHLALHADGGMERVPFPPHQAPMRYWPSVCILYLPGQMGASRSFCGGAFLFTAEAQLSVLQK